MKLMSDVVEAAHAQAAHQAQEAKERRESEEFEQRSELRSPAERIRIWERRHQLTLPSHPKHPLNNVIASQTALSAADLAQEVARRMAPTTPSPPIV